MEWNVLINDLQGVGMSQKAIAELLGKSQAWVSACARGEYSDLKWKDGEALRDLHRRHCRIAKEAA